ncbi:UbiA family prenyltransferase [Nocardia cyriacigeorgica]|uniref:UbiA family prenyltransferase n=1 Tax=Nocardia cyriacigeorgica TaxID=135487 RepID=UPI0018940C1B|nr:UbiA family prenyltransferase [Nocardia cyriacigeorgica]MBF6478065.1 UbiA family prenyltransferase [Nocardia cyriacigeorgica]
MPGSMVVTTEKVGAYARLGNIYFFDQHLCFLVALSLLPYAVLRDTGNWWCMLALFAGYYLLHHATASFDDISGFRDGSDARNYLDNPNFKRKAEYKPLILGQLTLREALWCAWSCTVVGGILLTIGFIAAPFHPIWLVIFAALMVVLCLQYSYGLNLSHIGGQELVLFCGISLPVPVMYLLFTGEMKPVVIMQTLLLGLWQMLVSMYSNLRDREVDLANGRINMVTKAAPRSVERMVIGFMVAEPVVVVGFVAAAGVSPWYLAMLIPIGALRVKQFRDGADDALSARLLGRRILELGIALLVVLNIITQH